MCSLSPTVNVPSQQLDHADHLTVNDCFLTTEVTPSATAGLCNSWTSTRNHRSSTMT